MFSKIKIWWLLCCIVPIQMFLTVFLVFAEENRTKSQSLENIWMVIAPFEEENFFTGKKTLNFVLGSCFTFDPQGLGIPRYGSGTFEQGPKQNWSEEFTYLTTSEHVIRHYVNNSKLPLLITLFELDEFGIGRPKAILEAEIVGCDPHNDVAVIKTKYKIPAFYQFGNLNDVIEACREHRSYPVEIIGYPHGFLGISEGQIRFRVDIYNNFIQQLSCYVDSPENSEYLLFQDNINPGSSGGPMIGKNGINKDRILGMIALMIYGSNMGFAVPVDKILQSITRILTSKDGKVEQPFYTGLITALPSAALTKINREFFKKEYGFGSVYFEILCSNNGAMVVGYADDSKLRKSLPFGAIITHLNDELIDDPKDFITTLKRLSGPSLKIGFVTYAKKADNTFAREERTIEITREKLIPPPKERKTFHKRRDIEILGTGFIVSDFENPVKIIAPSSKEYPQIFDIFTQNNTPVE